MSMALAARFSPLISFNAFNAKAAVNTSSNRARGEPKSPCKGGRRDLLLLSTATALVADSRTDLLNKYLKKSQENKAKNDKERLDSYYKRNYKDYFGLLEGDLKEKKDLSESEKGILEWLENNK